jgi:hypothetical protein
MEYRGIEYSVVKMIDSKDWQWSVRLPNRKKPKVGSVVSREFAIRRVEFAIDGALGKSAGHDGSAADPGTT